MTRDEMQQFIEQNKTAMKKLPSTADAANVVVRAASDLTSYMTGTIINQSVGHILE